MERWGTYELEGIGLEGEEMRRTRVDGMAYSCDAENFSSDQI